MEGGAGRQKRSEQVSAHSIRWWALERARWKLYRTAVMRIIDALDFERDVWDLR